MSDVFGLTYAVLSFDEKVTIDDFGDAVLDQTSGSSDNVSEVDHAETRSVRVDSSLFLCAFLHIWCDNFLLRTMRSARFC